MKQAVNNVAGALQGMTGRWDHAGERLVKASWRIVRKPDQAPGRVRRIVQGVNEMLDAVDGR